MGTWIIEWVQDAADAYRRQALVARLSRFSDHLLADIGLRRDQLDGMLLAPSRPRVERDAAAARPAMRPSLQGCG